MLRSCALSKRFGLAWRYLNTERKGGIRVESRTNLNGTMVQESFSSDRQSELGPFLFSPLSQPEGNAEGS
jgi:hypothetical protein